MLELGRDPGEATARCNDRACLLFDRGALKEIRISGGPQFYRIRKDEVAEVQLVNQSIFNQFVRFVQYGGHIWNVEMADVRAEHRAEACAERIGLRVECPCIDRIVGLTTEIESRNEQFADIFRMLDPTCRKIVKRRSGSAVCGDRLLPGFLR